MIVKIRFWWDYHLLSWGGGSWINHYSLQIGTKVFRWVETSQAEPPPDFRGVLPAPQPAMDTDFQELQGRGIKPWKTPRSSWEVSGGRCPKNCFENSTTPMICWRSETLKTIWKRILKRKYTSQHGELDGAWEWNCVSAILSFWPWRVSQAMLLSMLTFVVMGVYEL